jgi:hypothetical protein
VDCNQSVALLSRGLGKSPSTIAMRLARSDDDDSCLLRFRAATGTPFLRAEEFMHYERVIAHSAARTLSLRHDIVRFFICCFAASNRFCARVTYCRNVNRQIDSMSCSRTRAAGRSLKSPHNAESPMLTRFLRLRAANRVLAFKLPSALKVFNNEAGGSPSKNGRGRGASSLSS